MAYGNGDDERGYENRKSLAQTMAGGVLGAFPPPPNAPTREPMVQRRMMELGKVASLMHDAISQLEARLQSVLAPESSAKEAGDGPSPKAPGLAQQIQDSAETVAHGIARINRLIGRLEL